MKQINGFWTILTYSGVSARKFNSAYAAGKWANKTYGVGNWVLQWNPARDNR